MQHHSWSPHSLQHLAQFKIDPLPRVASPGPHQERQSPVRKTSLTRSATQHHSQHNQQHFLHHSPSTVNRKPILHHTASVPFPPHPRSFSVGNNAGRKQISSPQLSTRNPTTSAQVSGRFERAFEGEHIYRILNFYPQVHWPSSSELLQHPMHPRKASAPPVQQQIHHRQHNHHRQHRHSCVHHQQALRRQSCHWDRLVGSGGYSSEHELIAPASPCSSEGRRKRATLASLGGGRSYFDQRFPHLVIEIKQLF